MLLNLGWWKDYANSLCWFLKYSQSFQITYEHIGQHATNGGGRKHNLEVDNSISQYYCKQIVIFYVRIHGAGLSQKRELEKVKD